MDIPWKEGDVKELNDLYEFMIKFDTLQQLSARFKADHPNDNPGANSHEDDMAEVLCNADIPFGTKDTELTNIKLSRLDYKFMSAIGYAARVKLASYLWTVVSIKGLTIPNRTTPSRSSLQMACLQIRRSLGMRVTPDRIQYQGGNVWTNLRGSFGSSDEVLAIIDEYLTMDDIMQMNQRAQNAPTLLKLRVYLSGNRLLPTTDGLCCDFPSNFIFNQDNIGLSDQPTQIYCKYRRKTVNEGEDLTTYETYANDNNGNGNRQQLVGKLFTGTVIKKWKRAGKIRISQSMCMFLARDNEFFDAIDVGNMVKCRVQAGQFNGRKQLYCTQVQAVDNMGAWNNNRFMGGGRQWRNPMNLDEAHNPPLFQHRNRAQGTSIKQSNRAQAPIPGVNAIPGANANANRHAASAPPAPSIAHDHIEHDQMAQNIAPQDGAPAMPSQEEKEREIEEFNYGLNYGKRTKKAIGIAINTIESWMYGRWVKEPTFEEDGLMCSFHLQERLKQQPPTFVATNLRELQNAIGLDPRRQIWTSRQICQALKWPSPIIQAKDQNRRDDFGQFKIKKTRNDWRQYMEKVARRVPTKQQYAKPPRAPKNNNNSRKKKKNKHAQLAQKQNNQNKSREAKKTEVNVNVNDGAEIATDVAMQEEGVEGAGGGGGGN
eukprot:974473_1